MIIAYYSLKEKKKKRGKKGQEKRILLPKLKITSQAIIFLANEYSSEMRAH